MNNTETIAKIAEETGMNRETVACVVKSFEEYGVHNLRKMRSKYLNDICEYIFQDTGVDKAMCKTIVLALFEVLNTSLTDKLLLRKC